MSEKDKKNIPEVRFDGFDEEWEKKRLGDDATLFAGGTPSTTNPDYWNGDINWLCSGAVQNNVISEDDVELKITEKGLHESSAKMIKPDSVLIAMTGATCGNVGYLPFKTSGNQSVMAVEPNSDDAKFLYYNLLKNRDAILKHKAGGAQAGVNKASCENIEIMYTSLEEQKKIAEFFKQLDKLIELNEKKVEKLEAMKKSLLEKMFPVGGATTPKIRFDGFCNEWFAQILENCAEYNTKVGTDCACKFVSTDNMMKNCTGIVFSENNDTKSGIVYKPNDILISNIRPYLKKSYLMEQQGICSTDVLCIRPNGDTNPNFLYLLLSSDLFFSYVMESTKGTKMPRGDKQHIIRFPFMISTSKEEQKRLACCIKNIDTTSKMLKCKIEKLRNLMISFLNKMIPHTHTHTHTSSTCNPL